MVTDPLPLPSHEQIATFRVGAILGAQAVAAYVEPDRPGDPFAPAPSFERLPAPLKIRSPRSLRGGHPAPAGNRGAGRARTFARMKPAVRPAAGRRDDSPA